MPYQFRFFVNNNTVFQINLQCTKCVAMTEQNKRCQRTVCIGTDLCWIHLEKIKHLKIKDSTIPNAGKGLFAYDPTKAATDIIFRNGDVIGDYVGETINLPTLNQRYGIDHTAPYAVEVNKGVVEDCARVRGYIALTNDSLTARQANSKFRTNNRKTPHRVQLVATKNIKNNTEILVNYGNEYTYEDNVTHKTIYVR